MSLDSQKTREDLEDCSLIYSSKKVVIKEIKVENLVLACLLRILAKGPVGKRLFDLFWF